MTKVSEISEFDLIARLETVLEQNVTPNAESKIQVAIGDDAAVIGNLDNLQVVTTDAMVDKVHFVSDEVDMRNLGWKSLAVNYSDIASMGCKPVYSVVTLGLRADISVEQLENLYLGFSDLLNIYGGELVGGDIVKSDTFFISITVSVPIPVCVSFFDTFSFFSSVAITVLFSVVFAVSSCFVFFKLLEISSKDGNSDAKARRIKIISVTICGIS